MNAASEFSFLVRMDALGEIPRRYAIAAGAAECRALAQRFGLSAIDRLEAKADCVRKGDEVAVTGRLTADVTQVCVASGADVPAHIAEDFALRFLPNDKVETGLDEIELSETDCDVIGYEGGAIDLGEAVAETLLLSLDPFPRSPDAATSLKAAGVLSEDDVTTSPFAALGALRNSLQKDR